MTTQQGARQAAARAIASTTADYNGDMLAMFAAEATIAEGQTYNGALMTWLQERLGSSNDSLPGLMQEFAEAESAHNWSSLGTFEAAAGSEPERTLPSFVSMGTLSQLSNNATDAAPSYPATVTADNLLLLVACVNDRGASPTIAATLSGWTHLETATNGEIRVRLFYRQAVGTETGAISPGLDWGPSGDATNDMMLAQIYQFTDVDWTEGGPFSGVTVTTGDLTSIDMPTVVSTGLNGLAVAVVCMSDDAAAAAPTGESGGNWVDSGHGAVTSTTADDAAQRIFVAEMATPGTITGGSSAITPSTPQTSKSVALGFALRGELV